MRMVLKLIAIVPVLYLCVLTALYAFQRPMLYLNYSDTRGPVAAGFPEASVLHLATEDDERLVAWYVAPDRGRLLALYFHGNAGPLAIRGAVLSALTQNGMGVLAIDYRGFGGSTGSPSEEGLHHDAEAVYKKARDLGYAPNEILLVGESLGTGVAVNLASRHEVAGVVLDSSYSSTLDVASERYWMFPVSLLLKDRFRSDELIQHVQAPILMLHGDADRVIPIRFGEKLFSLAQRPKEFLRVAGAGHLVLTRPEGLAKLSEWMGRLGRGADK